MNNGRNYILTIYIFKIVRYITITHKRDTFAYQIDTMKTMILIFLTERRLANNR